MNACLAAKESLTIGSSASSVAASAASSIFLACGGSISLNAVLGPDRAAGRGYPLAVVEQLVHLRADPAVLEHARRVVVDHADERVRLLAVVAVDADELVLVAPFVGVDVALGGGDHAEVLGPARGPDAGVDQRDRRLLGRRRLP